MAIQSELRDKGLHTQIQAWRGPAVSGKDVKEEHCVTTWCAIALMWIVFGITLYLIWAKAAY
jgi:hypothetical protein